MNEHGAIYKRIKAQGASCIVEWLRKYPFLGFADLARQLGPGVLGEQLARAAAAEAEALSGFDSDQYVRENLVRWIHVWRPGGWGHGERSDARQAAVVVDARRTAGAQQRLMTRRVWRQLREMQIPPDWLPMRSDDPVLAVAWEGAAASTAKSKEIIRITPEAPWGDYGRILAHGTARRIDGKLCVVRCGPFVPPVSMPSLSTGEMAVVVRDDVRASLKSQFSNVSLREVGKERIVRLEWLHWSREAAGPAIRPAEGEPDNYLLQEHSVETSEKLGPLWELPLEVVDPLSCDKLPLVYTTSRAVGVFAGDEMTRWLKEHEIGWIRSESEWIE